MPRFRCVSGHRGPVNDLTPVQRTGVLIGDIVANACPRCGQNVQVVPCNKPKYLPFANRRGETEVFRRPLTVRIVKKMEKVV